MSIRKAIAVDRVAFEAYCTKTGKPANAVTMSSITTQCGSRTNQELRRATGEYRDTMSVPIMMVHVGACLLRNRDMRLSEVVDNVRHRLGDFDVGLTCDILDIPFEEALNACAGTFDQLGSAKDITLGGLWQLYSASPSFELMQGALPGCEYHVHKHDRYLYTVRDIQKVMCQLDYSEDLYYLLAKALLHSGCVSVVTLYRVMHDLEFEAMPYVIQCSDLGFTLNTSVALNEHVKHSDGETAYYDGEINKDGEWIPIVSPSTADWELQDMTKNPWDITLYSAVQHFAALSVTETMFLEKLKGGTDL